ncbi:ferric reductase-like transmembrane domain-containing protein [uncultured Bosea sp.]|uniref:ferric reductase-like transmembrane domain-containing protein n=1 Tax=uncultured Bosea sp. TaxID=211457 RepID=UPI0025CF6831|nr:ferric reductase-like transmembrane domain-containing protein [uncultured Bosea sp.]
MHRCVLLRATSTFDRHSDGNTQRIAQDAAWNEAMQTQRGASASPFHGWCLAAWLGLGVAAACAGVLALSSDPVDGTRMVIRLTARTSLLLFVLAFTASSLAQLLPSPATTWLRANRRYVGGAFAFSHVLHAAAIVALSQLAPVLFGQLTTPASLIAGGLGYAVILLMFATSFDRAVEMLGPQVWRILHKIGAWFLAIFFAVNFGRRAVVMPEMYWPYMALIVAAIVVRVVAGRRKSETRTV